MHTKNTPDEHNIVYPAAHTKHSSSVATQECTFSTRTSVTNRTDLLAATEFGTSAPSEVVHVMRGSEVENSLLPSAVVGEAEVVHAGRVLGLHLTVGVATAVQAIVPMDRQPKRNTSLSRERKQSGEV